MSTTPQIIKDQEFQIKFRGYDPVEVKAYLDMIAEEFFELQERCRLQVDDLQDFHEEREELEQQKISLEASYAESRKMAEELRQVGLRMEQKIAVLTKESEGLQARVASLEQEIKDQVSAQNTAESRIHEAQEALLQEKADKETLQRQIERMENQQRDARKDEVDFKATLAAAQLFCDSMKEKSTQQAKQFLDETQAEIEQIRQTAHAELASLPQEIKALQQKREEVRQVLRTTLESYLHNLEIFPASQDDNKAEQESVDLFQKIQILDDGSLAPEDLVAHNVDFGVLPATDKEEDLLSFFGGDDISGEK